MADFRQKSIKEWTPPYETDYAKLAKDSPILSAVTLGALPYWQKFWGTAGNMGSQLATPDGRAPAERASQFGQSWAKRTAPQLGSPPGSVRIGQGIMYSPRNSPADVAARDAESARQAEAQIAAARGTAIQPTSHSPAPSVPVSSSTSGRRRASSAEGRVPALVPPKQPATPVDPLNEITMIRGGMQSQGNAMPEGYAVDVARRRAQMNKPTSPFDSYEGTEFMRKISGMIDNLNLQRGYAPTTLNSRRRAAFMASNDARIDNAIGQLTNALGGAFTEKGKFYEGVNRDTLGYDQSMYGHDVQDRNYAAVNRNAVNRYALDLRKLNEVEIPAMRSHSRYEDRAGIAALRRPEASEYAAELRAMYGPSGGGRGDTKRDEIIARGAGDPAAMAIELENYDNAKRGGKYIPPVEGGLFHKGTPGGWQPPAPPGAQWSPKYNAYVRPGRNKGEWLVVE